MKRLFIILCVLLFAVNGWGTTYYVDYSTGNNVNTGTASGTAWKDLDFAANKVAAGDTVYIVATADAPMRNGLDTITAGSSGNEITWRGTSDSTRAHLLGTINATEGATIPEYFYGAGNMEGWISTTDPNHNLWIFTEDNADATNTLQRSTTPTPHGGTYATKMVYADANIGISKIINLAVSTSYTLSRWHYETADNFKFILVVHDREADEYLQDDIATWGGWNAIDGTNSNGSWTEDTTTFTTQSAGEHQIFLYQAFVTTSYLDDVTFTDDAGTFTWAAHDGDTKKIAKFPIAVKHVTACTTTNWTASGVNALRNVTKAANLAGCIANAGTWWHETSTLFFHPSSGAISTWHIEAGTKTIAGNDDVILLDKAYNTLQYLNTYSSNRDGIRAADEANLIINNCKTSRAGAFGFVTTTAGTGIVINDSIFEYTAAQDGCTIGAGTATLNRVLARYNFDEGFEAYINGTITANYCIAHSNGNSGAEEGFSVIDAGTDATFYNCVSYNNYGDGIAIDNNDGTIIIKNCISYDNNVADGGFSDVDLEAGQGSVDADYNCYNSSTSDWDDQDGANNLSSTNPLFKDAPNSDFTLKSNSPCINTGTGSIWSVGQTDYDGILLFSPAGNPMYGTGIDMGAFEFQFSHPWRR